MGTKSVKHKSYTTRYAGSNKHKGKRGGVTVTLPFDPRKGICKACGKSVEKGEIKSTHLHHWWYAYQPKTVKANPILAIENTTELCFYCHQLADAIRALLYASPTRVAWVASCLRGEPKQRFMRVLKKTIEEMNKTETNIKENAKMVLERVKNGKSKK